MVASVRAWACLVAAVVMVVVPSLPRVSCLPQELNKPVRDSPRALYHPYRERDTPLASLVETFAQNDLGKGHMFDLDLTLPSDTKPSVPPPPKFNIHTFTFNEKNVRKPGDIFSLLADVKGDDKTTTKQKSEASKQKPEASKQTNEPSEAEIIIPGVEVANTFEKQKSEASNPMKQKTEAPKPSSEPDEAEIRIPGVEVVNTFGKKILMATQDFQELMGVVQRMKKKVEAKLSTTNTTSDTGKISLPSLSSLSSLSSSLTANASSLVSLLLDSERLDEIRTAGLTAKTEDEFLDHLTSVLIGGETRGTALTLDPVTIIALLTLAAYLIRAVYQVLTVTGRSLEVADLTVPLHLADLPEAMVNIHRWIASPDTLVVREKRSVHTLVGNILDIPGNLAAVIKLYREGHRSCVHPFVCQQIQRRSFPDVTITDMLIAGLGYYFGESSWAAFIDNSLSGRSAECDVLPVGCSPRTLDDAHYLETLYTSASYKFFNLLAMLTNLY